MVRCVSFFSLVLLSGVGNRVAGFQPIASGKLANSALKNRLATANMMIGQQMKTATPSKETSVSPSQLFSTAGQSEGDTTSSSKLDVDALVKYGSSIVIQMGLLLGVTKGLDLLVALTGFALPFPVVFVMFYALSIKSRVFNPLNNDRPDLKKASTKTGTGGFKDRNMPSFTPPGFVFPIAWLLVNSPLRAYGSALVYQATGQLATPAILAFLFHLSVGDVWNTINNAEQRYGASASAVVAVWITAAFASLMYYQVDPLAGKLLGGTLVWLTLASNLVISTWKINPDPDTCDLDSLYPVQGEAKTQFSWFADNFAE